MLQLHCTCIYHIFSIFTIQWEQYNFTLLIYRQLRFILFPDIYQIDMHRIRDKCAAFQTNHFFLG